MANRTDKEAASVHGTNPQNLVEYILRQKIYDSLYWKQDCFGLSAEHIVDKAVDLRFIGGMFGEPQKPTDFICLILKMLQIQPDKEIILEFIKNDDFKYLRLLGAFYLRLVGKPLDVFNYLEPLLNDYRRVRVRDPSGTFILSHIDELIDQMLRGDYLFHIALPRLPARHALEKIGQLEPRVSVLEEEFEEEVRKEVEAVAAKEAAAREEGEMMMMEEKRKKEKWQLGRSDRETHHHRRESRQRSRSRSRDRDRDYHNRGSRRRYDDDDYSRSRSRSRERGDRRRRKDRSPSGHRDDDDERRYKESGKRPKRDSGNGDEKGDGGGGKEALSIEETNKMRAALGLAPLK